MIIREVKIEVLLQNEEVLELIYRGNENILLKQGETELRINAELMRSFLDIIRMV